MSISLGSDEDEGKIRATKSLGNIDSFKEEKHISFCNDGDELNKIDVPRTISFNLNIN